MNRILVIEDELQIRNNIQQILELSGYDVVVADNGEDGIDVAQSEQPDLIVSDIRMPRMDGYQLLSALQKNPITQDIPLIFLTARVEREDLRRAMSLGADDYVTKPFTPEELLSAIETRLAKRSATQAQIQTKFDQFCGQLSRTLPHELNTPLNGITTAVDFLSEHWQNLSPDDMQQMLRLIQASANRLNRLTQNFLLYADLELKAKDHPPQGTSAPGWIGSAATDVKVVQSVALEVATQYDRPQDLQVSPWPSLQVEMPSPQFRKIMLELLDNAFKFSKPGRSVSLEAQDHQSWVEVILEDRGRGMTSDQILNIGAYTQFERKLYEQQGCGLGLCIAQRMTQLFGGTLTITSTPKVGTKVTVQLPRSTC